MHGGRGVEWQARYPDVGHRSTARQGLPEVKPRKIKYTIHNNSLGHMVTRIPRGMNMMFMIYGFSVH